MQTYRGIARNVAWRQEGSRSPTNILTFRIEQLDGDEIVVDGHIDQAMNAISRLIA